MKIRTLEGETLEAPSLQRLAEILWQGKFNSEPDIESWMAASARRAAMWNGSVIRTTSPAEHVADLIAAGILERIE